MATFGGQWNRFATAFREQILQSTGCIHTKSNNRNPDLPRSWSAKRDKLSVLKIQTSNYSPIDTAGYKFRHIDRCREENYYGSGNIKLF